MSGKNNFKIISVTGAHSQVGKTTLASILLKNFNNFGAIKFTKTSLVTSVTDDPGIIREKNKDTAILSEAGAEKVYWIQSPARGLKEALDKILSEMTGLNGVIVEGNSPSDFINPHLRIFIIGENGEVKPSAGNLSKKADIIVVNSKKSGPPSIKSDSNKAKLFVIDLLSGTGDMEDFIACVKKILGY